MERSFAILNSFSDSIAIVNRTGEIIFTNDAWRLFSKENSGNSVKTDQGVNYLDLCEKVNGEEFQNAHEAAIGIDKVIKRELPVFEMEYPCHSFDEKRWFIMRCIPLKESAELTIISHINITNRKIAEEFVDKKNDQLSEINKRLKTTIYKIGHDIQGPLNSMEGLINLSKIEESESTIRTYFSYIEKSVLNLKEFTQETISLATSTAKIEVIKFDMIVNDIFESVKYSEHYKQIELKKDINQISEFFSYKSEIVSIISNVIYNSLKYYDKRKKKSILSISINSNDTEAHISIKDNGIGINRDNVAKIFDLNFQVNKDQINGFGVGLNLVKKSIQFINGSLNVQSEIGEGSEFTFIIPNLKES